MFEEEKLKLEEQISEIFAKLQEIELNQQEIKDRTELIREYEKTLSSINYNEISLIVGTILVVSVATAIVYIGGLINIALPFYSLALVAWLCVNIPIIKHILEDKKTIKENKIQYKEAKAREEKDKELSLTLSNGYTKIEQDMLPLQYRLSRIKKIEALEKLGYQLELMASKLNEQYFCMIDNRNKEAYEQLWEQYLEESKDYSKVHLYNPEMNSTQVLVKKL